MPAKHSKQIRTITRKHLAVQVAEKHALTKAQSEAMLGTFVKLVNTHLVRGHRVHINGLGVLEIQERPARLERNPATGKPIKIKPLKTIKFRPYCRGNRDWP